MREESSGSATSVSFGSKRNQTLAEGEKSEVAKSGNNTPKKSKRREIKDKMGLGLTLKRRLTLGKVITHRPPRPNMS